MKESRDRSKETGESFKQTLDLSKMLYDNLNGVLERAINLPANIVPAIAQRMEMNKKFFEGLEKASRNVQTYGAQAYTGGLGADISRGQGVRAAGTNITVKMDVNALGELMAKEKLKD
jgi:hypothetical protein